MKFRIFLVIPVDLRVFNVIFSHNRCQFTYIERNFVSIAFFPGLLQNLLKISEILLTVEIKM